MLPTREEAEQFVRESEEIHPGPWGDHCRVAAWCAERIAEQCEGMDAEKAYIVGLFHDIGRRITVGTHFKHIIDGYRCMMEHGWDEAARICMTHSFQIKGIHTYIGNIDVPPEDAEEVEAYLTSVEYDDYDLLIQLCDALALPEGPVAMEKRIADITKRYGSYPEEKRKRCYELRDYFEKKMGKNLYEVLGIMKGEKTMSFQEVSIEELQMNPFTKIGKEWMLITAGNEEKHNTMTASWGGVGVLWGKNVVTAYIRPQRYTKEFVDAQDVFTLSFFGDNCREALTLCGKVSGKDRDKIKEAGLTPYYVDGTTAFEEAELVFVCRKLYADEIRSEKFIDKDADENCYPQKDYHTMYIAEITKVLVKK